MFEELRPLQMKHLELLEYIDSFCEENDITYCLAYGSALGARRHGGPIPWDDDIDIHMSADDYARFRRLFCEKGEHKRFHLQEIQAIDGMANGPKLRMNGTAVVEESFKNMDMHQGIYVDIFLVHDAPKSSWQRLLGNLASAYLIVKDLSNTHYHKRKFIMPLLAILRLFPKNALYRSAFRKLYQFNGLNECDDVVLWDISPRNKAAFMPKSVIFPPKRMNYEGRMLCVPGNVDRYLEICYGNWQEIPGIDEIEWAQHATEWSTTKDYREICPNIHDFSDEYREYTGFKQK